MDENCKKILNSIGIDFMHLNDLDGQIFPREMFISQDKYDELKEFIPELRKKFSSSFMTSLQKTASENQKWPLLNLIRQILNVYGFKMEPIRKSNGYTPDGIKKYKRFFIIQKINSKTKIDQHVESNI